MKLRAVLSICVAASAACASGGASTRGAGNAAEGVVVPAVPEPVAKPASPMITRVTLPPSTEPYRYRVESVARIERDSAGVKEGAELRTTAQVTLSLERDSVETRGSGVVDAFVVRGLERTGGVTSAEMSPLRVPFEFAVDSLQVRVAVSPALANVCDQPETGATTLVRDLLVRLPRELMVGATWSDSSAAFVCRAGVPIVIRTHNSYTVDRIEVRDGRTEVAIIRGMDISLEGSSTVAWRARSVRGSGGGTQSLRVDAATGALVELDGTTSLELDVGGDRVTQAVELSVRPAG